MMVYCNIRYRYFVLVFFLIATIVMTTPTYADDFWTWDEEDEDIQVEEIDEIPSYWMEELEQGAKEINLALQEAGSNKSAFLFYSDSHWTYNSQRSPMLLKYLYQHTGMTKTIFGGDIVMMESSDYDTMTYLWEWRSMLKDLPNHHSVVGNHDDGNTTNHLFDDNYVYGFLLAAEETPDIVRGDAGFYYYIDVPSEKTRYLYLDTANNTILYDAIQVQFLVDALMGTPDGWHIVVAAHQWYYPDYSQNPPVGATRAYESELVLGILDDYNARKSDYVRVHPNATDSNNTKIIYDFTDCHAKVEFCVGGHTHCDFDGSSDNGIPVILVETDSYDVRSGLELVIGSTSESSVNGIIADYEAKKVTIVRIGRGENRVVPLN